jgi:hypothetical protein
MASFMPSPRVALLKTTPSPLPPHGDRLLERGARVPRIDTLIKLATALDIKQDALLAGIAWKPQEVQLGRFR